MPAAEYVNNAGGNTRIICVSGNSYLRFHGHPRWCKDKGKVDIAEPVTLIARKPATEEETSLVNIEGIKATLLMEWAFKGRAGIGRCVCRRMTRSIGGRAKG